ncbi:MAG: rRNA maturation RNase YbeY [Clostridiales bacterium]|nr:rRNA maturation RNase YbeY [Clostridiales bacterium]
MTIYFENESSQSFPFDLKEQAENVISFVCDHEKCPYEVEVSVTMVEKETIRQMNATHREVDRVTDVLSFPMMEYDVPGRFEGQAFENSITISPESEELVLGDIVLCSEVIQEQAKEFGHSQLREFSFLIVHSMLHLFGYDHMEEEEREQMEKLQREIMDQMGISR